MSASRLTVVAVFASAFVTASNVSVAQDRANPARDAAVLAVDGVVREVFQSPRQDRVDFIVLIEVKRSEALRSVRAASRVLVPAPGDFVYVHASQRQDTALGLGGSDRGQPPRRGDGSRSVPFERAQVRAYLGARSSGGWEGVGSPWFELTSEDAAAASATDPTPPPIERAPTPGDPRPLPKPGSPGSGKSVFAALGLTGEVHERARQVRRPGLERRAGRPFAARGPRTRRHHHRLE